MRCTQTLACGSQGVYPTCMLLPRTVFPIAWLGCRSGVSPWDSGAAPSLSIWASSLSSSFLWDCAGPVLDQALLIDEGQRVM